MRSTRYNPTLYNAQMLGVGNWRLFDAVVAPNRNEGDYTQVDQAIDAGAKSIFIKEGTYAPFTIDNAETFVLGENLDVVIDGAASGHGITVNAANCRIHNLSVKTTGGGGNTLDAIFIAGSGCVVFGCQILDSDRYGINVDNSTAEAVIAHNRFVDSDSYGVYLQAARCQVLNNYFNDSLGASGIYVVSGASNFLILGNFLRMAAAGITIAAGGDSGIYDGNIMDVAVSDSGTGNTAGSNEVF